MESGQASVRYNCTNRRQAKTLVVESGQASVRYNVGFKFHCRYVVVESGQASVRYNGPTVKPVPASAFGSCKLKKVTVVVGLPL